MFAIILYFNIVPVQNQVKLNNIIFVFSLFCLEKHLQQKYKTILMEALSSSVILLFLGIHPQTKSQGHPTFFCKINFQRRSKYRLKISKAQERVKISG